jgi:hypothetical protein
MLNASLAKLGVFMGLIAVFIWYFLCNFQFCFLVLKGFVFEQLATVQKAKIVVFCMLVHLF